MVPLIFLALMVAAFWFLIIRPQRKQMAAHQELLAALEEGDEVVTSSGIYGRIDVIDEATIDLEIAEDVVIRVSRASVTQRLGDEPEAGPDDVEDDLDLSGADGDAHSFE
ncbi:MAG: preprotein translocase subunit YajC [Acidimicrobiia bacterium]